MIGALIGLGARIFGSKIGGSLIDKAGDVVTKVIDQKGSREAASAAVDKASIDQWTAESAKVSRNWFDSMVDGFNRLMRPVAFGFTVWVVMIWPQVDLIAFQKAMVAYEAVPEWLVGLVLSVWAFLFTGRFLTKDMVKLKSKSSKEFQEILRKQQEIHEALTSKDPAPQVIPEVKGQYSEPQAALRSTDIHQGQSTSQLRDSLADTSRPLSLPSIVEWNKRNNPNF